MKTKKENMVYTRTFTLCSAVVEYTMTGCRGGTEVHKLNHQLDTLAGSVTSSNFPAYCQAVLKRTFRHVAYVVTAKLFTNFGNESPKAGAVGISFNGPEVGNTSFVLFRYELQQYKEQLLLLLLLLLLYYCCHWKRRC